MLNTVAVARHCRCSGPERWRADGVWRAQRARHILFPSFSIEPLPSVQRGLLGAALLFSVLGFVLAQRGDDLGQTGCGWGRFGFGGAWGLYLAFGLGR